MAASILPSRAQTGSGVVQGTITDATGGAIPNAKATLTNTATGVTKTTQSNNVGLFYFGAVQPGPYEVTVEAPGFKRWGGAFRVDVGQTVTIDPNMEIGTLGASIEVRGVAPVIETEGMQVSDIKDSLRIQSLPLNGRAITNLFDLTPGVEGGANPRVNGLKVGSAEMLLDGISMVSRFGGGIVPVQPGLDTVQEFRVETAGSDAQYSRPATISVVTKSGTNDFHGTAYETHRNNFGGLRARARQDFYEKPPQLIRNEFGASAGGRVIRNKTFWFASYEGLRQRQARFARTSVPTEAMWNGDFGNAITRNREPIIIYDPLTTGPNGERQAFAGNLIPRERISQFASVMRSVSAAPVGPNAGGNPWIESNFEAFYPQTRDTNTYTIKGDQIFSEKDSLSGRFTRSWLDAGTFGGVYGFPPPGSTNAGGTSAQSTKFYSTFVRWNHVFSPTLLNELQASSDRSRNHSGTLADQTEWATKLGFGNPFGALGWPTICASGPFYDGCWDAGNPQDHNLTGFQIVDDATWIRGTHTLRFGFKGRSEYNNVRELQQAQGSHSFGADWTALYDPSSRSATPRTGSGFASLLLGYPTYLSNQYNRGYFYFRQKEVGLYAQDNWRVSQRLTLNLGVRWDYWTPYSEKYNRLLNLDLNNYVGKMEVITPGNTRMEDIRGIPPAVLASWRNRGLTWKTAEEAGFPSALLPRDTNNFAPRLGAALRLSDRWVIRSGYGVYYWTMPLSQLLQSSRTNPPFNLRFTNEIGSQGGTNPVYALTNRPAANETVATARVSTEGVVNISRAAQGFMPWDINAWGDNTAQEWTLTVERELMKSTSVRASYIGNHGSNLEQRWRWNDPESVWNYQARTGQIAPTNADLRRANPNWTSGCCNAPVRHNGYSNAHSVQAEVERRYASGLAFQWFYTFSRVMTTTDTGGYSFGSNNINSSGSGTAFAVPEPQVILGAPRLTEDERLRLGYANTDAVPAHRIRWNGIYDLPFGRGKKFGGGASTVVNHVIGGWQIAFIGDWRSGLWQGVNSGLYLFGDPILDPNERLEMYVFGRRQRLWFRGDFDPTLATGVDQAKLQQFIPTNREQRVLRPLGSNFDNRLPQTLANGQTVMTNVNENLNWNARNFFRGAGSWNQDLSVFKNFLITERVNVRFTADFFNAFNHPVDVSPNNSTGLQDLSTQANEPRIIQLSLRLSW
ncbi:MAG TPA: TonB-dependent receptor [Bryobacteraceae bacterium]|nr:TonB-dependent receptor [Bryobacteraceae bacterium]